MKIFCWALLLLSFPSGEGQEKNTTSTAPVFVPKPTRVSWTNVAYAVEGAVASVGNLLIVLAILSNKALRRKELLIIAGLAFSELIRGMGYLTAGIRRGWLEATGYLQHPSTPWHCLWVIHNPLFIISIPLQPIMWTIVSFDRLLAIKAALWYWKQRKKYAYVCLSVAGLLSAVYVLAAVIGSYLKPVDSFATLSCNSLMAMPKWMGNVIYYIFACMGWSSVLIYILVLYFFREHGKNLPNEQLIKDHLQQQRQMTKTIGVCVLITLFTVCLGYGTKSILSSMRGTLIDPQTFYTLSPMIGVYININMMANVFIYSWRQREIRSAIVRILTFGQVKLSTEVSSQVQRTNERRNVRVAPQPHGA